MDQADKQTDIAGDDPEPKRFRLAEAGPGSPATGSADPMADPVADPVADDPLPSDQIDDDEIEQPAAAPPDRRDFVDPAASVGATLVGIGAMFNHAGVVSQALTKHLRSTSIEPELHAFLHRMQSAIGDFRNSVTAIEQSVSEELRAAIEHVAT